MDEASKTYKSGGGLMGHVVCRLAGLVKEHMNAILTGATEAGIQADNAEIEADKADNCKD